MGLFRESSKGGLELISITDLSVNFRPKIYKIIQDKLCCSDNLIDRIKKAMPTYSRCKKEAWEHPNGMYYERNKFWITADNRNEYDEREESFRDEMLRPIYIWEVMLWELLTEQEAEAEERKGDNDIGKIRINFVYCDTMEAFLLYLSGGKFEKKPEKESLADMRPFEEKLVEDSIIFKLPVYDFKYLELYHCDVNNTFITPNERGYYVPFNYYRKYDNWFLCSKEKRKESHEIGIAWTIEFYDFAENFLPKLKQEK